MNILYTVNVGLWFAPSDVKRLRELTTTAPKAVDRDAFKKAATATENGMFVVYQTMTQDNLNEFIALFTKEGITAPIVQELRLESTARGLRLRA